MDRIIVAVDGSPDSFAAAELADTLARSTDARIELVFVVEPGIPHFPVEHAATDPIEQRQRQLANEALARAAARLHVPATSRVERGGPAETLCRLAAEPDVTMVVAGSHGHHSILRSLLGSASQRLLRQSQKPVVLVRGPPVKE